VFVLKKYRKRGIGIKLIDRFLLWCKEKKAAYVSVSASFANNLGTNFYKKNGFVEQDLILRLKMI